MTWWLRAAPLPAARPVAVPVAPELVRLARVRARALAEAEAQEEEGRGRLLVVAVEEGARGRGRRGDGRAQDRAPDRAGRGGGDADQEEEEEIARDLRGDEEARKGTSATKGRAAPGQPFVKIPDSILARRSPALCPSLNRSRSRRAITAIIATERRRGSRSSVSSSNAAAPPLGVVGTTCARRARPGEARVAAASPRLAPREGLGPRKLLLDLEKALRVLVEGPRRLADALQYRS